MSNLREVLDYIIEYKRDNDGNSPTRSMIAAHFKRGRPWASRKVSALEKKAVISVNGNGQIKIPCGHWGITPIDEENLKDCV